MSEILLSEKERKNRLIDSIHFMIESIPEQFGSIVTSSLSTYFKSLVVFGMNSEITRSALIVLKDMFKISRQERALLKYILANLHRFNIEATERVIDELDELNDKTYMAYDRVFADIEDACDMNNPNRFGKHETIDSLISNEQYSNIVYALNGRYESVKEYLAYPQEFWDYIEPHQKVIPYIGYVDEEMYGIIPVVDEGRRLALFKTVVPSIADYDSAKLAIDIYRKAYQYYLNLGNELDSITSPDDKDDIKEYVNSIRRNSTSKASL